MAESDAQGVAAVKGQLPNVIGLVDEDSGYGAVFVVWGRVFRSWLFLRKDMLIYSYSSG